MDLLHFDEPLYFDDPLPETVMALIERAGECDRTLAADPTLFPMTATTAT